MKTIEKYQDVRMDQGFNEVMPAEPKVLSVDWTESEWFKVWLKLARHQDDAAATEKAAA